MNPVKSSSFINGGRIILRPLEKKDINKNYLYWFHDAEVTKYLDAGIFPMTMKQLEAFYASLGGNRNDVLFAVVLKSNKKHIGNVKLGNINWIHRFADISIVIGEKQYWNKGYAGEAFRLMLDYAFRKLNLNKVILGVYSPHAAAIKSYLKIGFKIEGRLKKMIHFEGGYVDKVMMGILKSEYLGK